MLAQDHAAPGQRYSPSHHRQPLLSDDASSHTYGSTDDDDTETQRQTKDDRSAVWGEAWTQRSLFVAYVR